MFVVARSPASRPLNVIRPRERTHGRTTTSTTTSTIARMAPFAVRKQPLIKPTFHYPIKLCIATTLTTWILSLVTGNVSQVDRLWTFLPTIYSAYWALLPVWPHENKSLGYLAPYVPKDVVNKLAEEFHPRALLMFGLIVSRCTFQCSLDLIHPFQVYMDVQVVV